MHDPAQLNKEPNGYQWLMANGSSASTSNYDLWHRHFGHPGKKSVEELPGKVKGVPDHITALANPKPCDGCKFGKSKHAVFPSSESRTEHLLDLIHMDLVEYPVQSIDGYHYTLTTLDDHSSFGLTWFLKHKSDTLAAFKQFVSWAEHQSNRKLKSIRSDQGSEFLGREFNKYLAKHGIKC
jgi:transposase InsO family protein